MEYPALNMMKWKQSCAASAPTAKTSTESKTARVKRGIAMGFALTVLKRSFPITPKG
jgi:hypothetical protein